MVSRIRGIGRDPQVLAATLEADRREREARQPELAAEARRLATERTRLDGERRGLVCLAVEARACSAHPVLP